MTPEDKLKDDYAELIMVWKWYKQYAYIEKSDDGWTQIGGAIGRDICYIDKNGYHLESGWDWDLPIKSSLPFMGENR